MVAVIFTTREAGAALPDIPIGDDQEWARVLEQCGNALRQQISRRVYVDGVVRAVSNNDIYILKRDEQRLWTRSMAREDAEATLLQAMHAQAEARRMERPVPIA